MLLAYIDEFGHIGPYISESHAKFNDHPLFGYGGFVLPADNVRHFGGHFEYLKERLLEFEIRRDGAHARRWEKKGSSLLTTRNHDKYGPEIKRTLIRLARKLKSLDGRAFYYGQVKPIGSAKETGETSSARSLHALRQAILRLSQYADHRDESIMIFTDSVDSGPRLEAVMASASFIYSAPRPELRRVVEVPMQLESHLYGTTQYADWVCALLSRSTHHHLTADSEFAWAPKLLRQTVGYNCTPESKIRGGAGGRDLYAKDLCKNESALDAPVRLPAPRPRERTPRGIGQPIGIAHPELAAFRDAL
ncbi:DUF3800 domain-containing protein [Microbacterium sp. RU33B]|uniref:DUF3800 domain-containing protein n=1 Tax=Microbacterium sp. RU33B TaxID=1907390 RepID=UPI00095CD07E|nr:DUF3800 domain-containing protein [Microbacterium sp. RU33B]SIT85846.1 Protein of unknown function [Microbacterium sp. RU33B]